MQRYKVILSGMCIVAAFTVAGAFGVQDDINAAASYERGVCKGAHPNFKGWEIDCERD